MHLTPAALALLLFIKGCASGALSTNVAAAAQVQAHTSKQTVPQILASLEERLKSLGEALKGQSHVEFANTEVDLEGLARRLEAVETRLGRIEGSLDTRLNTLSENLGRRQGKEEMAAETTNNKLQSISETIFNKMGHLEAKMDFLMRHPTEVQGAVKKDFSTSSACCHQLTGTITSGENRLRKEIGLVDKKVEEIKTSLKNIEGLDFSTIIQTLSQNIIGFLTRSHNTLMDLVKTEIGNLETKVREISTDLWSRTVIIENKVVQTSAVANHTYSHILEFLRRAGYQGQFPQQFPQTYYQAPAAEISRITSKINQLGRDMGFRLINLQEAQDQLKNSCRRIQDREMPIEKSIENYLIRIHENFINETIETKRLLDTFYSTDLRVSRELEKLHGISEKISEVATGDAKNIFKALNILRDTIQEHKKEFTVDTVATRVTEDLKPILLKFVDESVLEGSSYAQTNSSIFSELEDIISQNKNNSTEEITATEPDLPELLGKEKLDEDEYVELQAAQDTKDGDES
ncbi:uncharacterized protein LOC132194244 [Neocloeon triangulifer]|uniref:uncharacterized protein LOC132194244 n=1 Tax=Neocloeon triangulifer TaxID=2078957 RepID=UPI00286EDFDA|nr:uncharacterized protein LOC132194244 [Neocloeon triangulifer]